MIRRHSRYAMFMHWSNAACWLFLLFSGFALLTNPRVQPIGEWWTHAWGALFGGPLNLLNAHVGIGIIWIALYVVYLVCRLRSEAWAFVREITDLHPQSDMVWCMRKGMRLTIGEKFMRKLGLNPELPPQGFYNAGQKLAAVAAVGSSVGLALTGILMLVMLWSEAGTEVIQWCLFVHLCCAGGMVLVLPVHIYMAALAPGEGPALRSMFTGMIPLDFVKRHNPLWYKKLYLEKK